MIEAPDLRKSYPRSPAEVLGGFVILARLIDKCRAVIAGKEGEYKYNCPVDQRFFDFTNIDADEFKKLVAKGKSNDEIVDWVQSKTKALSDSEIAAWCYDSIHRGPSSIDEKTYFEQARRKYAPKHPYISGWFQLLDAEEGRISS
jgi:hypothetical protein